MWDIKRDLVNLPVDELYRIAKGIGPISEHNISELDLEDSERCFEHIDAFMSSVILLERDDKGMRELLTLQEMVTSAKQNHTALCTSENVTNNHNTHTSNTLVAGDTHIPPSHHTLTSGGAEDGRSSTDSDMQKMLEAATARSTNQNETVHSRQCTSPWYI